MKLFRKSIVLILMLVLCLSVIAPAYAADDSDKPVKGIKFENSKITVNVGDSVTLIPVISPEDATNKSLTWSSSNSNVASVDGSGKVTAVDAGTVTITAEAKDGSGKSATATVFVPEICADKTEFTISKMNPDPISINFYGSSPENLTVKMSGKFFDYSRDYPKDKLQFTITPLRTGTGTLTIEDKIDKSKVVLTINVEQTALKNNKTLLINSASVKKGSYNTGVNVKLENTGTKEIVSYALRIDYLNKFDEIERLYVTDNGDYNLPEYATEAKSVLRVERTKSIVGGKTLSFNESYVYSAGHSDYAPENINVAVCWYRLVDGTEVTIPDNQLAWFNSKDAKYIDDPYVDEDNQYKMPDAKLIADANSTVWGYSSVSVYKTQFKAWYLNHSGELITVVTGPAEKAGIEPYDLIWAVNGIKWEDDPFIMERAKVLLNEGKEVTFSIERYGKDIELKVKN